MPGPSQETRCTARERDERQSDANAEQKLDLHRSNGRDRNLPEPLHRPAVKQAPSHRRRG